jgi:hypothetical protein
MDLAEFEILFSGLDNIPMSPQRECECPIQESPPFEDYTTRRPPGATDLKVEHTGDMSMPGHCPLNQSCYLDVDGHCHVKIRLAKWSPIMIVNFPHDDHPLSVAAFRVGLCKMSEPIYVHGMDPSSKEVWYMGKYKFTHARVVDEIPITMVCVETPNGTSNPVDTRVHHGGYTPNSFAPDCCMGCDAGIGCFR